MCGDEAYSTVGLLLRFNRFDAVEAELTNCFMTVRLFGSRPSWSVPRWRLLGGAFFAVVMALLQRPRLQQNYSNAKTIIRSAIQMSELRDKHSRGYCIEKTI